MNSARQKQVTQIAALSALLLVFLASRAYAFRGFPRFVKVQSVELEAAESSRIAKVCYSFATTTPLIDYDDFVREKVGNFLSVKYVDRTGATLNDPQTLGIEIPITINRIPGTAYLNSDTRDIYPTQLEYFNSAVKYLFGTAKSIDAEATAVSYDNLIFPQYENVAICEKIPFPLAWSDNYIKALFSGTGSIGLLNGSTKFEGRIVIPLLRKNEILPFSEVDYVVPIFGLGDLDLSDYEAIALAHFANSVNFVKDQLTKDELATYLLKHQEILEDFKNQFGLAISLPITSEELKELFQTLFEQLNNYDPGAEEM